MQSGNKTMASHHHLLTTDDSLELEDFRLMMSLGTMQSGDMIPAN